MSTARPPTAAAQEAEHRGLRPLVGAAAGHLAHALSRTWRVTQHGQPLEALALRQGPVVYAFWHGEQLPLAAAHAHRGIVGLASQSRDGAVLARAIRALGYDVARGSTSRGGRSAIRVCLRALSSGQSVALAVDGPRGPRHRVAPGVAGLAELSGRPVVCVRAASTPALRLGSWDRFELPAPFARVAVHYAVVGPTGDRADTLARVQAALEQLAP